MSKDAEIINLVYDDDFLKSLLKDMDEKDRDRVDAGLRAFVSSCVSPLVESFEALASDPEAIEELKRQLGKSSKEVVKAKDSDGQG